MSEEAETVPLQCNDPVFVRLTPTQPPLEGVLLYMGAVPEMGVAPIYMGVRLTGAALGCGTNDGSLSAVRYFDCPPDCGLFVLPDQITKRSLTKLEALRLRRELASFSSTATSSSGVTGTPSTVTSSTGPPTAKSRLEELRLRREALKSDAAVTPSKEVKSIAPPSSSMVSLESEEWKMRYDTMQQQLAVKKEENVKLQKDLVAINTECSNFKIRVEELQQRLNSVQGSATLASKDDYLAESVQKEQLESELSALQEQFTETQGELSQLRAQLAEVQTGREEALIEMTRARAEVTSYQNQLRALTDQTTQRGASDAVHYKERAKLSADVSALQRKIEQMEHEKNDLEASLEDLTLDKDQLKEEKEALEEKYEDLKLDAETSQMELEELRMELEDVRASAGRAMGVADSLTVAAMASAGSPSKASSSADAEEMIQSMQTQNARLREALIRLREQSGVEKLELTRQLRTAEKEAEQSSASQTRLEELSSLNRNLEEQVNALKDMVEQSAAFEMMVEDLSDRVMLLEEQNVSLNTVIRELEESAELTAEMEEVQADELKAISRDLEGRDTLIRNLEEAIKM